MNTLLASLRFPFVVALSLTACSSPTTTNDAGDAQSTDSGAADARTADVATPPLDATPDVVTPLLDATPDAHVTDASSGDGGACAFAASVSFGVDGGLAPSTTHYAISAPRTFTRTTTGGITPSCSSMLLACAGGGGGAVGVDDVNQAFADADVVAALARGNVTFGNDSRAVDGQVFLVTLDAAHSIAVGDGCAAGSESTCTAIPPGVAALRTLLGRLITQEDARVVCGGL